MSSSSSPVQAIPSALFFIVPIFSFFLFHVAVSRPRHPFHSPGSHHHQGISRVHVFWSYFAISSLTILAILVGALGLTLSILRPPRNAFRTSSAVFVSLLRFELGLSVIYLATISIPYHTISAIGLCLYNTILAFVLLSATFVSVLYPFFPNSIPPLVAPILALVFTVLPLPLLVFLFLSQRSLSRSTITISPPRSPTSKREKGAYVFTDEPLMVNLCLARGEDVRGHISNSQRALVTPRAFYAFLFCAQLSAATTSALSIGSVVLFGRNDIPNVSVVLVFDVLRSVLSVLGILCTMSAYLYNSSSAARNTSPTPNHTPFTAPPARSTRSLQVRYPPRSRNHPPTPTPSQLSEDFRNLRDPFASPSPGVASRPCSDMSINMLGREFPSIRKVVSGRLDSSIVHASADTSSCLPAPTHLRSHRTGRSKPLSVPALDLPKTKRNHRRVKKGSSHGLTISPHSAPSFPFPTHAKSHNRNVSRYRSTTGIDTSTSSSVSDDTSFDHEEAILTQLLLRSLDSESRAGSGSGGGGGLELADMLSPPATHRFTQDSTSTGATLCESEMFKLKRGSVSTAFSSPPASPGGATGASRSEGS